MSAQSDAGPASPVAVSAVNLIPWDFESPQHAERLIEQRVCCGYNADKVAGAWRDAQRAGSSCLYWITLQGDDEPQRLLLEEYFAAYPQEAKPLTDTSAAVRGAARHPSHAPFYPIGHIGLDAARPAAAGFGLNLPATGNFWLTNFFISPPLQGRGLGRATMDRIEAMAVEPPLTARTLALDTMLGDDQQQDEVSLAYFGRLPTVINQRWYERRGYVVIKTPDASGG
ncbi:Acyl-CoA N-acyltransferase [Niveomyces insectorum RCEF 264]|uniref:Acyl-CoA N-acyltransferase n=1 Tax=Niveomyces insectorum RCEF 264 TaxID=1081102 RepID=A0A167YTH9_9HYPO|nr:Acyl-CoA N-acyltransferase [Niveomyces insectorum RCEF 264]